MTTLKNCRTRIQAAAPENRTPSARLAIRAGEALALARQLVGAEQYPAWVESCGIDAVTAQEWVYLAAHSGFVPAGLTADAALDHVAAVYADVAAALAAAPVAPMAPTVENVQ